MSINKVFGLMTGGGAFAHMPEEGLLLTFVEKEQATAYLREVLGCRNDGLDKKWIATPITEDSLLAARGISCWSPEQPLKYRSVLLGDGWAGLAAEGGDK